MKKSVFYTDQLTFADEPMFYGTGMNIQEYANPRLPAFEKADNKMMGFFWRPEEISLLQDNGEFKRLTEGERFIFVSNLKYQILLDSIQSRGVLHAFLPATTLPELEAAIITWGFFEKIHSRSYTHIIRNLFPDPADVTDHILDVPEIMSRAASIGYYYDDFIDYQHQYLVDPNSVDMNLLKEKLYLALMCVNILEGLRFYVSFACNFAFGENKTMEGTSKIMSLISRDETQHLGLTQNILKYVRNGSEGPEWAAIAVKCAPVAVQMFRDAASQEKMWADYLFTEGSMIGLNAAVLHLYIDHITNKRMRAVGLDAVFPPTRNPLNWMDHWLNSRSVQNAGMEVQLDAYLVGAINSDISDGDFDDFSSMLG